MIKLENFSFNLDDDPEIPVPEDTTEQDSQDTTEEEEQDLIEEQDNQDIPETTEETQEDGKDPLAQATFDKYVALGVLEPDEEFDGTFDYIESRLDDAPVKLLNQAIQELPEQSHAVLQFITAAGANITKDEIIKFVETWKEEDRTSFEMEDEARTYLADKLKTQGLRDKAIQAQLDDLEDEGELLNEANKLLAEENTKTQKLIESKKAQTESNKQAEKQWYSAIQEELKTLNYTKRKNDEIQKTMANANKVLQDVYTSPKAVIQLMDLLTKFNGKEFDLSDFEKQGTTKAVSGIREAMAKSAQNSAGTKTASTQSEYVKQKDRYVFGVD